MQKYNQHQMFAELQQELEVLKERSAEDSQYP